MFKCLIIVHLLAHLFLKFKVSVLLQVCPRESEDQNILPCYRHMDVWRHSLGDVHTWSGALAGS